VAGPQAFVAERNLDRVIHPEQIPPGGRAGLDTGYLITLGDDTVPTVVATLNSLPSGDQARVRGALFERWRAMGSDMTWRPWPAWNLSRQRAWETLDSLFRTASGPSARR
jgi:hypothetical protein